MQKRAEYSLGKHWMTLMMVVIMAMVIMMIMVAAKPIAKQKCIIGMHSLLNASSSIKYNIMPSLSPFSWS